MKKILGLLLLATIGIAIAAPNPILEQELVSVNKLENPGFESGSAKWTASGGATTTANTTAKASGNYGYEWDSNGASQTLVSTAWTIDGGVKGRDGVAYCDFKAASGTATHTIQVYDGTNVLNSKTITSDTSFFRRSEVNFVFPSSGTVQIRIVSVAANEPSLYVDNCYLGLATNITASQVVTDWVSYTPTGSWVSNTTYTGKWRRVGDEVEITITVALSGAPTATTLNSISLPSGVVIDTNKIATYGSQTNYLGFGSAKIAGVQNYQIFVLGVGSTTLQPVYFSASGSYVTDGGMTNTIPATFASGDHIKFNAKFPVLGWTSQNGTSFENANWKVNASISGANPSLSAADVSTYTDLQSGTFTLTNNSGTGNINAEIPCASGTAPSGTTCSAANESIGIAFTPQGSFPQDVEVCAEFGHNISTGAAGNAEVIWQLVETTETSTSPVTGGKGRRSTAVGTQNIEATFPLTTCGTFTFSSGGKKVIRLMYEQDVNGTINNNRLIADALGSAGDRDIHITARPILDSNKAPVLIGSVTSNSTTAERSERAEIASCTGAGNCTINSQSGPWLSTFARSSTTGDYTGTIVSGIFQSAPTCVAQCQNARVLTMNSTSATSFGIRSILPTGEDADCSGKLYIQCQGAR